MDALPRFPLALTMAFSACAVTCGAPRERAQPGPPLSSVASAQVRVTADVLVDTRGWAGAADSTYAQIAPGRPDCIIDRGCPFDPAVLPSCPTGLEPMDIADVLDRMDELTGKAVLVRGHLRSLRRMTLVECMMSCCNSASGPIALWPPHAMSRRSTFRSLALWDAAAPNALRARRRAVRAGGARRRRRSNVWLPRRADLLPPSRDLDMLL